MRLITQAVCVLFFGLTLGAAFAQENKKPTGVAKLSDADLTTLTIRFERKNCYGSCPAYTVTIHGDGAVEYTGKGHVKLMGDQTGHIDTQAIRALLAQFEKAKFASLREEYVKDCARYCTDMPTVITELEVRGTAHRVTHYYGCSSAPKTLFELETAIDKTANTEQWTADVSMQGPYGTTCWDGSRKK